MELPSGNKNILLKEIKGGDAEGPEQWLRKRESTAASYSAGMNPFDNNELFSPELNAGV